MFGKPIPLMKLAGFKIGLDISWFFIAFLLAWTLATGYFPFTYPDLTAFTYGIMGILGMLGLFVSVVLHELGHAVVARHFNIPIERITLFIFGGVAELKQEPTSPKADFLVAIAGPLVTLALAAFFYTLTLLGRSLALPIPFIAITNYLTLINIVVFFFNLVPAFPLDGGRVLRALIWWKTNNLAFATKVATYLGAGFGFILIFFGILSFIVGNVFMGLWWMILGLFLYQAAAASKTQLYVKKELENEKVKRFMTKNPISVAPDITLKNFIDQYVYQSHHHLYPVVEGDNLLGYISLKEVKSVPATEWEHLSVRKLIVPLSSLKTITPLTSAFDALNLFQQADTTTLLVVNEHNQLVGLLTAQDIFKLISIKLELEPNLD